MKFYDSRTLCKIGNKLGTIIKIDVHTNDSLRGQYAHICVQVSIDKPLKQEFTQVVIYEGLNMACFECGKVGHKNVICPNLHRTLIPLVVAEKSSVDVLFESLANVGFSHNPSPNENGLGWWSKENIKSQTKSPIQMFILSKIMHGLGKQFPYPPLISQKPISKTRL